jgi:uncharacterized protein (TIGR03086 family)
MHMPIIDAHRRAVLASVEVVSRVTAADLGRDTPCAGWHLGDLLTHMTAQHRGFAAAAQGAGADLAAWQPRPLGDDPAGEYATAAHQVLDAFAADGVLARDFALPEITTARTFPGAEAITFHLVDYVAHGWDVARSLGLPYELDPEVLELALRIAKAVPDGESRLAPGAAFAPAVSVPENAPALDLVVALLGRSPAWPA